MINQCSKKSPQIHLYQSSLWDDSDYLRSILYHKFGKSLNDKDFASGVTNQAISIAPLSEGVISIKLTSTLFSLIRQMKSMQELENKPFSYELYGKVFTKKDLFAPVFSEKGEIDLNSPTSK